LGILLTDWVFVLWFVICLVICLVISCRLLVLFSEKFEPFKTWFH
jgi:hypothetical protein